MNSVLLPKLLLLPLNILLNASPKKRKVGGQAIIEGVMMRGKDSVSWAVQKNDTEVIVERETYISLAKKHKFFASPVLRGAISLFESVALGYRALARSGDIIAEEQETNSATTPKKEKKTDKTLDKLFSGASMAFTLFISFGIFMYLPMRILSIFVPKDSALLFNLLSGSLRIVLFLTYLILISLWKEIRRVFEYHGAEHKAIYTYEDSKPLTLENMRPYTTLHPRCGTSFLLLVGIICILLYSIVDAIFIATIGPYPTVIARVFVHLLLIPIISGVSYEVLRLSDKYQHLPLVGALIQPGLMLQKITTKEPIDAQLIVAAKALEAAL